MFNNVILEIQSGRGDPAKDLPVVIMDDLELLSVVLGLPWGEQGYGPGNLLGIFQVGRRSCSGHWPISRSVISRQSPKYVSKVKYNPGSWRMFPSQKYSKAGYVVTSLVTQRCEY